MTSLNNHKSSCTFSRMLISEANIQVPFSLTVSRILNSSCESLLVSELIYLKTSEDCELKTTVSDFMAGNCLYVCEGSKDEGANSIAMTHTLNNSLSKRIPTVQSTGFRTVPSRRAVCSGMSHKCSSCRVRSRPRQAIRMRLLPRPWQCTHRWTSSRSCLWRSTGNSGLKWTSCAPWQTVGMWTENSPLFRSILDVGAMRS